VRSPVRLAVLAVAMAALVSCSSSSVPSATSGGGNTNTSSQVAALQSKIQHIIVIYQENWSFDSLYSKYPGANGSSAVQGQVQFGTVNSSNVCSGTSYVAMSTLTVQPLLGATNNLGPWPCGPNWVAGGVSSFVTAGGSNPDPTFAGTFATPGSGLQTSSAYSLNSFDPTNTLTGDITHVFWHEQIQIDNGTLEPSNGPLDKFVIYSSNPGYVLSQYDATNLPEGKIAQHYTMADNFFHSAFGGSFLNHQWLICACTPVWNQAFPTSTTTFQSTWNPTTKALRDSNITLIPPQLNPGNQSGQNFVVNTTQTANQPHSPTTPADQLLNPIPASTKTIGDLLTDASPSISWKWYSGDWSAAVASPAAASACQFPPPQTNSPPATGDCFQFHHQPFNYFARWGSSTPANCAAPTPHLCDEQNFFSDLTAGNLPAVSFIKPVGVNNEHPNYSSLIAGQNHVQQLMAAICASQFWNNTIVIITYDENGGRWDHVNPPKIDQWGPGVRVPAIIASPYAKAGFVDHTQYETTSILALIEARFGLSPLGSRDAADSPLINAFNFNQTPLSCQSS
jgi:acid phosphatase